MSSIENMSNNTTRSNKTPEENLLSFKKVNFNAKEKLYFMSIDKFFRNTDKNNIKKMWQIVDINYNSKISLRLLDWFVTRYANRYKTYYYLEDGSRFNVHISYKAQLKSYKKRYFDPFRRRKKFYYRYTEDDNLRPYTTIGQLNFFRWAFTNDVIKYVETNYDTIIDEMIKSNKQDKKKKQIKKLNNKSNNKSDNKSGNITINAKKIIKNEECKIILSFD